MHFWFCLFLIVCPIISSANTEPLIFDSANQETQYRNLITDLRCLVCQNQNIADSNADLAKDLRLRVYEMVKAGNNDEQISAYMTHRYGDFVLYKPPVNAYTLLLWFAPAIFLLLAIVIVVKFKMVGSDHMPPIDNQALVQIEAFIARSDALTSETDVSLGVKLTIFIVVFFLSGFMYLQLGDPDSPQKNQLQATAFAIKKSIPGLLQFLLDHPEDRTAWLQLAESYRFLQQDALADQVMDKVNAIDSNHLPHSTGR